MVCYSSKQISEVECYTSIDDCLTGLKTEMDVFVIGGAQIYKSFFPYANSLHITFIDEKTEGIDTYFPIPLSQIERSFIRKESQLLTENAQYTCWLKVN